MYRGRKRTIYQGALEKLQKYGLTRDDAFSVVFGKAEKVKRDKPPRSIYPRKPAYNLVLGTYLKHIEKRIYRAIDEIFGGPTVISGYDVVQVGEIMASAWSEFSDPVGVGLDAIKYDMHVHEETLKWEHSIYLKVYNYADELKKILGWQIDNRGAGYCQDGKLKFKIRGSRFSGDMNTALGNKIIMCGMVFAYAKERGVKIRLINNGDDCMVIMDRQDLQKFLYGLDAWFAEMGFRMTTEDPRYELEQLEFCQMHPIRTSRGWTMVRNIPTAREKDSMCLKNLDTEAAMRKWMMAIGECGLALCAGVPIMQSMYAMYLRNGMESRIRYDPCLDTGLSHMRGTLESRELEILPSTRAQVYSAWDITPAEQIAIEEMFDQDQVEFGMAGMELDEVPCSII